MYIYLALSYISPSESPGSPSSLSVSNVTNTSVVLSWSPPVNGGGRPLSEIFYTVTATGELVLVISREYSVTHNLENSCTNDSIDTQRICLTQHRFVPNVDTDERGGVGVRVELGGVNGTETSVTGLTPGVYYTFSVTAENAVSSQDNNINARTLNVIEEGSMHKQLHCIYINTVSVACGHMLVSDNTTLIYTCNHYS